MENPDLDATSCASVANNTGNFPPYEHEIEWANIAGGKTMITSGYYFPDELEHRQPCVLCGIKTSFYFYVCFNINKPNNKTPLCQVKRHSKLTKRKCNQTCMML